MRPREIKSNIEKVIHTCTLTAKSCEMPNIEFRLSGIPEDKAKHIYRVAKGAFRDIEIVSEITGEILMSHYVSDDWFVPLHSYSSTIDAIIAIYEGE